MSLRRFPCPRLKPSEVSRSVSFTMGSGLRVNIPGARVDYGWHAVSPPGTVHLVCTLAVSMCIAARGRVHVPDVLAQYRRPEQCVRYARERYHVYRCPGQGVRDARKQDHRPGSVRRPRKDQYSVR